MVMNNNKRGLSKLVIGYFSAIFLIAIALITLVSIESKAHDTTLEELNKEYGVNKMNGDKLVQCENGSLDVYRPKDKIPMVCGNIIKSAPSNSDYILNLSFGGSIQ